MVLSKFSIPVITPIITNLPSLNSPFHPLFVSSDRASSFINLVNCRPRHNVKKELLDPKKNKRKRKSK